VGAEPHIRVGAAYVRTIGRPARRAISAAIGAVTVAAHLAGELAVPHGRGAPAAAVVLGTGAAGILPPGLAALATDRGHVRPVATDDLAALAAGDAGFIGRPLVGRPLRVRGSSAPAGNLTLPSRVHRRESA